MIKPETEMIIIRHKILNNVKSRCLIRCLTRRFTRFVAALCVASLFVGLIPSAALAAIPKTEARKTDITVHKNDKVSVDASNLAEGYVIIKYFGGKDVKIKAQVAKKDGSSYMYDISNKGSIEVIPVTEGDGKYTISVFENIGGTKYAQAFSVSVDVKLRDQLLPFLYSNQYVNFTDKGNVASKATELSKDVKEQLKILENIYFYVVKNMEYDTVLAKTVQPGYLPNVEKVLEIKKGICFDYASLMSSMLRLQGIPSKLVIGYAGTVYHAWINVFIEEVGWIDKAIYFDGKQWSLMDPTFVSTSKSANAVKQFIGEGNNYSQKFMY